jgi:hypothetical protein
MAAVFSRNYRLISRDISRLSLSSDQRPEIDSIVEPLELPMEISRSVSGSAAALVTT